MQSIRIYLIGVFVLCFIHRSQAISDLERAIVNSIKALNNVLQHSVEELRHSNAILNATVQQSANVITSMNTTIQKSAHLISSMNSTIQKSAVELQNAKNVISTMNTTILKSATELQNAKNDISAMNATIQMSGISPPIIFHAYLSKIKSFGPDQTIEFDRVLTNVGNAYDPRHGHFTAPVEGYYHFSVTVMATGDDYIYIDIVKNGAIIGYLYCADGGAQVDSVSSNIELIAGDMVWVKHHNYNSELHKLNGGYNIFSGFIISKRM